jgi:hypothetical protein
MPDPDKGTAQHGSDLLAHCRLDTLAMVELLAVLQREAGRQAASHLTTHPSHITFPSRRCEVWTVRCEL